MSRVFLALTLSLCFLGCRSVSRPVSRGELERPAAAVDGSTRSPLDDQHGRVRLSDSPTKTDRSRSRNSKTDAAAFATSVADRTGLGLSTRSPQATSAALAPAGAQTRAGQPEMPRSSDHGVVQVAASADSTGSDLAAALTSGGPTQKSGEHLQAPKEPEIDLAAFEQAVNGTEVVALVNGEPIFASDILERYGPQLKIAFARTTPLRFQQLRRALIERDLTNHIERRLLATALKAELKQEQIDQIYKQLDQYFEQEIERLKQQLHASSKAELEEKLQEQGTSLATLRDQFINQQLAIEFVRSRMKSSTIFSRSELIEYYQQHQDEFSVPARVRWQQIRISFDKHGGKAAALKVLERCVQDLKNGVPFEEVARRYSDGPTADQGGFWDWTRRGSLADSRIEDALFSLPVGKVSQVFTDDECFQLVRVVEREDARVRSFEEVQEQIRRKLQQQQQQKTRQALMQEIYRSAVIETNYKVDLGAYQPRPLPSPRSNSSTQ